MNESLFVDFIKKIWPKLSLYVKEKVVPNKRTYLHKTMLRKVYSADQKWEGTSAKTTYVAADIVAMDSPLPVKKRGSIATSNGKLPKIGMKKILFETDINNINIMKAHLATATTDEARKDEKNRILTRLTDDGVSCSVGIDEKNEANFLTGLSDGIILVQDEENTGTGLRFNYGYLAENTFGVETKGQIERDDIDNVFEKADNDGNTIVKMLIAKSTYNAMRKMQWAREFVADAEGKTYDSDTKLPVPSSKNFNAAFEDEWGATVEVIDRTVVYEKNGKQKSYKPWNADHVIFICSEEVGSLVWGTLAEATNHVDGVKYATVDEYKLISKYSKNDPSLQEFTSGQALVLPVIEDVDQIYMLDVTNNVELDESAETADTADVYTTINGKKYKKADVVAQLKVLGKTVKSNATDATVLKAVNSLNDEEEAALYAALTEVTD